MSNAKRATSTTILAVASGGGHWLQMLRLRAAFGEHRVIYVSVNPETAADVAPAAYFTVRDANRWNKLGLLVQVSRMAWIVLRVRPSVVISTGAAPGYFALRLGKLLGARTIWIDSIANAEQLSLSGRLARSYADLWLTQWPEVAEASGARYEGRLL
jgi:UDP-N-acetylglucosamine:LPS N-acetylglucosamine transferase